MARKVRAEREPHGIEIEYPVLFRRPMPSAGLRAMNELGFPASSVAMMESVNDHELERRVFGFLRDLDHSAARHVTVEVADGVLTLRGRVMTFYARQVFVQCSRRIPGVVAVIDELRVES